MQLLYWGFKTSCQIPMNIDRIRDTLIHELCHAATWLIDGVKAGHGPHWKRWWVDTTLEKLQNLIGMIF